MKLNFAATVALVLLALTGCEEDNQQYGKSDKGDVIRQEDAPRSPVNDESSDEELPQRGSR